MEADVWRCRPESQRQYSLWSGRSGTETLMHWLTHLLGRGKQSGVWPVVQLERRRVRQPMDSLLCMCVLSGRDCVFLLMWTLFSFSSFRIRRPRLDLICRQNTADGGGRAEHFQHCSHVYIHAAFELLFSRVIIQQSGFNIFQHSLRPQFEAQAGGYWGFALIQVKIMHTGWNMQLQ